MTGEQPFINLLKTCFVGHFVPDKLVSYDECMIEYFGRHRRKEFIHGNPITIRLKMWVLTPYSGNFIGIDWNNCRDISSI